MRRMKRLGLLSLCTVGLVLMIGVEQVSAAAPSRVLKFNDAAGQFVGVGFNANDPNAVPPIGSSGITTLKLENIGSQFGKPTGATVGRVALDCIIMDYTRYPDGNCFGIAHVPDGYFTFEGNGGLNDARIAYYDITGGVGPYADDRGEIRVVNKSDGGSTATVTLYAP
jgi:hypothetical protein